jgi:hypothetical protein
MQLMMALVFGQQYSLKAVHSIVCGATIQKAKAANRN